jgi:hypothetical protein
MKVPKADFDKALEKLIRAPALPLVDIPKKRPAKRRRPKKATR